MKVAPETLTPAEMLAAGEAWYHRQLQVLAECHGKRWPEFEDWIAGYLKGELRERLIARGWRPKQ